MTLPKPDADGLSIGQMLLEKGLAIVYDGSMTRRGALMTKIRGWLF